MRRYLGLVVAATLLVVKASAAVNFVADVEVYAGDHGKTDAKHHEEKRRQLRAAQNETATTRATTTGHELGERGGALDEEIPPAVTAAYTSWENLQAKVEAYPPPNSDNNQVEKEDEDEKKIGLYCTKITDEDGDWYDCDQESEDFQDATAAGDTSDPESYTPEGEPTPGPTQPGEPTPSPTQPGAATPTPTQQDEPTPPPTQPGATTPAPTQPGEPTPAPTQPDETTAASIKPEPTPATTITTTTNSGTSTGTTGGTGGTGGTTTGTTTRGTDTGGTTDTNTGTSDTDTTANTSGTTTSVTQTTTTSRGRAALSGGGIAGIIIGCAVFVAVVVGAVLIRQKSLARQREENLFTDLSGAGGGGLETDYAAM